MTPTDDTAQRRLLTLLRPHHDQAVRAARRLCRSNADGDDLFQEAVLRAFEKLGDLRDPERFRSWFFAILLTVHRGRHRRSFWQRFTALDEARDDPADPRAIPSDAHEGAVRMARALATLPPEAREAIVLFELEGLTLEEVADLQRASVPAVKSRLVRARERLAQHYARVLGDGAPRASPTEPGPHPDNPPRPPRAPRPTGALS